MLGWEQVLVSRSQGSSRLEDIRGFIGGLYGPDLHAKRVESLAGATLGVEWRELRLKARRIQRQDPEAANIEHEGKLISSR